MAIASVSDADEQLEDLSVQFNQVYAVAVNPVLTPELALSVRDLLLGTRSTAATLLTDLAAVDENTLIAVDNASGTIEIWRWRRELRLAVLRIVAAINETLKEIEEFLQGLDERIYVVKQGDTLQSIAARELGSWEDWESIVERNPGVLPTNLSTGDTIVIPSRR